MILSKGMYERKKGRRAPSLKVVPYPRVKTADIEIRVETIIMKMASPFNALKCAALLHMILWMYCVKALPDCQILNDWVPGLVPVTNCCEQAYELLVCENYENNGHIVELYVTYMFFFMTNI